TLAGTRAQVMSLWKVDDAATRDLMVGYYERLAKGEGRGEALRDAQQALLKDDKRSHPYYWAAFIPSGAWGPMSFAAKPEVSSSSGSSSGSKSRRGGSVRDYWRNAPSEPIVYFAGSYSAPFSVDPFDGSSVSQRHGFGVDMLFNVAPRWLAGLSYSRTMWDIAASAQRNATESKLAHLELVVGVDALGLPRDWRFRPSLNVWVGGGLAWTKQAELVDNAASDRAFGLAGTVGADLQFHIRLTDTFDLRLGGGATKSGYRLSDDTIAGSAKYPGAFRWMAGGALGVIF
ncbi:MAG: CHAT domain-containing protein, partial [Nannocystaceae bacterium]